MSDPVAVDAGLTSMNRTREQWEAVNPGAFLTGSIVQARNVIEMARADILRLYAAVQAAEERAAERMRERAGDLAANAMKCGSCGAVFDGVRAPHTDENCPEEYATWETPNPSDVATAIRALPTDKET